VLQYLLDGSIQIIGEPDQMMEDLVKFDRIDFDQIEYCNEYPYGKNLLIATLAIFILGLQIYRILFDIISPISMLFAIAYLLFLVLNTIGHFVIMKSRYVITGSSITLKRPVFGDVELAYSNIGSIEFLHLRPAFLDQVRTPKIIRSERPFWTGDTMLQAWGKILLKSVEGTNTIILNKTIQNYDGLVRDLALRMDLADDRYRGYAHGSSLRQPERAKQIQESLNAIEAEMPLPILNSKD